MTHLNEIHRSQAGSTAGRWDGRSLDVASAVQAAEALRSEFIGDHLKRGLRLLSRWSGVSDLFAALRHRAQQRRVARALAELDDRLLVDIGVERADIDATAALCCSESPVAGNSLWVGLGAWVRRELRRRQTLRALAAMSDETLADIGVKRAEIPAIAAAAAESRQETATDEAAAMVVPAVTGAEVLNLAALRRSPHDAANQNHSQSTAA